ncbi:acyltransferase family protein [Luteolibacter luteus]|uniref:Acyltransferase family protein n=1 Tax=Luteolibacter luteus TaxID=2728835 RepID=A0A858RMY2_9BACT|nr:acyltransferase family protein [Luteolibacter luteus]QJE98367.1 acyltransferase family protein [Luteolibacter luteus]
MASSFPYRPSIDGLRAIAILDVFIFHLHPSWLPGGFVGVDVFFVLSGYLITSVITAEHHAGNFSLRKFYQRRIARLFPAFLAMAIATMVAALFIYSAQDLASTGESLAAAVASVINLRLMLQGGYFELSPDAEPFLHCWSLSVEEQFYLVYPILLVLLHRKSRKTLMIGLAGLSLASFALCLVLTQLRAPWAFYLLPTRAWELLAGGLFALKKPGSWMPRTSKWAPLAGIALLIASFALIREARGFPGYQALLPVIGTLAVIAGSGTGQDNWLQRVLASPLLVSIGKLSYSLYLWHWPVFSFVDYKLLFLDEWPRALIKIAITLPAAIASYRLIECPARAALNRPSARVPAFSALAASLLIGIPLGISIRDTNYLNVSGSADIKLTFNEKQTAGSIILLGDSHGSMYGHMVKQLTDELGYRLTVASVASGDPLPLASAGSSTRKSIWEHSLEIVRQEAPDVVILACQWTAKLDQDGSRLGAALEQLRPLTRKIILLTQPPRLPPNATREAIRQGARPPFYEEEIQRTRRLHVNAEVLAMTSENITVIDVENLFHDSQGAIPLVDAEGRLLYHDRGHLSDRGAQQVKARLEDAIKAR